MAPRPGICPEPPAAIRPTGGMCHGGFSDRDILRRQLSNDIIEHLRRERGAPAPAATFARVVTAMALGRRDGIPAAAVAARDFAYDGDVMKGLAKPGAIFKAASGPAMTTVRPGRASWSDDGFRRVDDHRAELGLCAIIATAGHDPRRSLRPRPAKIPSRADRAGRRLSSARVRRSPCGNSRFPTRSYRGKKPR